MTKDPFAAASALRAEAESTLAGIRVEAAHAVATARADTSSARASATAHITTLENQLEAMRRENHVLRDQVGLVTNEYSRSSDQDAINGTDLSMIHQRLGSIEEHLRRLELKLDARVSHRFHKPPMQVVLQSFEWMSMIMIVLGKSAFSGLTGTLTVMMMRVLKVLKTLRSRAFEPKTYII